MVVGKWPVPAVVQAVAVLTLAVAIVGRARRWYVRRNHGSSRHFV
jgi:hypothetical protein